MCVDSVYAWWKVIDWYWLNFIELHKDKGLGTNACHVGQLTCPWLKQLQTIKHTHTHTIYIYICMIGGGGGGGGESVSIDNYE